MRLLSGLTQIIRLRRQKKRRQRNIHMNYQTKKIHISGSIEVQTPTTQFAMNCPCFRILLIHGNPLIWPRHSTSQQNTLPNMMMSHHFLLRLVFIQPWFLKVRKHKSIETNFYLGFKLFRSQPCTMLILKTPLRPDMNLSIRNTLEIRMTSIWENWEISIFNFKIKIFHIQKKNQLQQISFLNCFLWSKWWERQM